MKETNYLLEFVEKNVIYIIDGEKMYKYDHSLIKEESNKIPSKQELEKFDRVNIIDKAEFQLSKNKLLEKGSAERVNKEAAIIYFRLGLISEVDIFRFLESEECEHKSGKSFTDLTTEEITAAFTEAVTEAIAETHALGLPTTHGDGENIYRIYPDGRKEIIKEEG